MASEKRMINAWKLVIDLAKLERSGLYDHENVLAVIASQETVDAVEVVHGHWYKAPHHPYRCSYCGEMALLDMYGESHYRSNYCPNCGAKMDGGNDDV